jgi:hypothetical protein
VYARAQRSSECASDKLDGDPSGARLLEGGVRSSAMAGMVKERAGLRASSRAARPGGCGPPTFQKGREASGQVIDAPSASGRERDAKDLVEREEGDARGEPSGVGLIVKLDVGEMRADGAPELQRAALDGDRDVGSG